MKSTSSGERHARPSRRVGVPQWVFFAVGAAMLLGIGVSMGACSAVQRVPDEEPKAFLTFEVEPASAEIYIDGDYKGTVEGWVEGAVPLEPGEHRVKVTAEDYITRRFDVELDPGESKILDLEMEPALGDYGSDAPSGGRHDRNPRSPLETEPSLPGDRGTADDSSGAAE